MVSQNNPTPPDTATIANSIVLPDVTAAKNSVALPDVATIEAEIARLEHKRKSRRALRNTIIVLVFIAIVAAALLATVLPAVCISEASAESIFSEGDIVIAFVKDCSIEPFSCVSSEQLAEYPTFRIWPLSTFGVLP